MISIDTHGTQSTVTSTYECVAVEPRTRRRFRAARGKAERLGYRPELLERVPFEAVASFAGVGHHLDLAGIAEGETVLDLGSWSGLDTFIAASLVGPTGSVIGIDVAAAPTQILPLDDGTVDHVTGNGALGRAADPAMVLREAARVLSPGGTLVLSDVLTLVAERSSEAMSYAAYQAAIEAAGFELRYVQINEGDEDTVGADVTGERGPRSISVLAIKR